MSNIKHVFFDLDHTLWDFDKNSSLAFEKILNKNTIKVNLEHFLSYYVPINLKYWKLLREEKISQTDLRYNRLKETFEALSHKISDEQINQISKDYIIYLTRFNYLLEGTYDILDYLKSKYKLHIITNGVKKIQDKKLIKSEIISYFETVTSSDMAEVKKPNAKIFYMALNTAKATPKESLMIGDSFEADILGALSVGMDAICYNYHEIPLCRNIKQVSRLMELKNML